MMKSVLILSVLCGGGFVFERIQADRPNRFVFEKPEPLKVAKAEPRPTITMYTASWCGPCQVAKSQAKNLPFDVVEIDVDRNQAPAWATVVPTFSWEAKGRTWYVQGFTGWQTVIEARQRTLK